MGLLLSRLTLVGGAGYIFLTMSNMAFGGEDPVGRSCHVSVSTLGFGDEYLCARDDDYRDMLLKARAARHLQSRLEDYQRDLRVIAPQDAGRDEYRRLTTISELPASEVHNEPANAKKNRTPQSHVFTVDGKVLSDGQLHKSVITGTIIYLPRYGTATYDDYDDELIEFEDDNHKNSLRLSGHALNDSQRAFLTDYCLYGDAALGICHGSIYLSVQRVPSLGPVWKAQPELDYLYEFQFDGAEFEPADRSVLENAIQAVRPPPTPKATVRTDTPTSRASPLASDGHLLLHLLFISLICIVVSLLLFRKKLTSRTHQDGQIKQPSQDDRSTQMIEPETTFATAKRMAVSNPYPVVIDQEKYARSNEAARIKLGKIGEEYVVSREMQLLKERGRTDLVHRVIWASRDLGDGYGYDVRSFLPDGRDKFIEVKATTVRWASEFVITANELTFLRRNPVSAFIYRVYFKDTKGEAEIEEIQGLHLDRDYSLEPSQFRIKIEF